jgi:hypothetical protein
LAESFSRRYSAGGQSPASPEPDADYLYLGRQSGSFIVSVGHHYQQRQHDPL